MLSLKILHWTLHRLKSLLFQEKKYEYIICYYSNTEVNLFGKTWDKIKLDMGKKKTFNPQSIWFDFVFFRIFLILGNREKSLVISLKIGYTRHTNKCAVAFFWIRDCFMANIYANFLILYFRSMSCLIDLFCIERWKGGMMTFFVPYLFRRMVEYAHRKK